MAVIGSVTTLRSEDFPDQQSWIGKLLFPLNQSLTAITGALNGNITYGENIPCLTSVLKFTYGSQSDYPKLLKWSLMSTPIELRVCSAFEELTAIAIVPVWYYANGQIYITNILKLSSTGVSTLTAGSDYLITLRAQP